MKPLTIDQLKSLGVGDWVWFVNTLCGISGIGEYRKISANGLDEIYLTGEKNGKHIYSEYGKDWLAYKNKEQAEAKGKIVELPEPFVDTDKNAYEETTYLVYRPRVEVYCPSEDIYTDKIKAENRLSELKGETK